MAETAEERRRRLTNEMMKGTGVTADDLSEWLAYTDEEVKGKSKSDKKKEAQKKRIQKQRLASIEKGKKAAQKLAPDLVESTKKKRESWILPEGEEMTWKPTPDQLRAMEKKDREVAKYAPQFKKAVEESEETGVLGSRDHSLKYRGEAPKRDTGSPSFHPSDPGAREKISNQTFRKAAGDRIKRLRHERAIMQSRPRLEEGNERWHKRPDSEEIHERYMDMAGTEKQLGDEEMPGLMNLYETDRDSRIKRAAEYKQFSDDAKLSALERARRGEVPLQQGTTGGSLEDLAGEGSAAYTEMKEREHEKYGGIGRDALEQKHLRDKGLTGGSDLYRRKHGIGGLPPSVRARLESPEAAGTRIAPDDPYMKEIAGDPDAPGLKEWAASGAQATIEGDIEKGMAQDEEERAVNEEFAVQQDMQNMTEDEQNEVIQTVQQQMGPGSEQAIAAKEATGRYVRYEGSGFVINKSKLDQAFDRQRKMQMLQHIPQKARASMLYKWGFIDKEDLNEAQQQSAKEIADLNLTNVRIEQIKQSVEKQKRDMNKKEMSKPDGIRYGHLSTGYIKALSDKNWDLAKELAAQAKDMGYAFSGSSVDQLQKNTSDAEMKAFKKLPAYKQMTGKYGDTLVNQFLRYKEKLMTQTTPPVGKKGAVNDIFQIPLPAGAQVDGDTYGDFLRARGYDSFENISKSTKAKKEWARRIGVPVEKLSEQRFNTYVFPEIRKLMLAEVYGGTGMDIENSLSLSVAQRVDELDDRLNNPEQNPSITPSTPDAPDASPVEVQQPDDADAPPGPVEKVSKTGTAEEMQEEIDRQADEVRKEDIAFMEKMMLKDRQGQSEQFAGEMQANFEDVVQEIQGYDMKELQQALKETQERLARFESDPRPNEPEKIMIKQTLAWLRHKIAQKGR